MQSQFDVSSITSTHPTTENEPTSNVVALLERILQVQQETLEHLRTTAAAQDPVARWRSLLAKWTEEYPDLPHGCQQALPILERVYGAIVAGLVEELEQSGDDGLDNDFTLQEFLDRYGMRLGQLGNIVNLVGPLAEASAQSESSNRKNR